MEFKKMVKMHTLKRSELNNLDSLYLIGSNRIVTV